MNEHLSEATVGAYLERTLSFAERREAQRHLSQCEACRDELVAVGALIRPRKRRLATAIPLAAAAVIALVLVVPHQPAHKTLGVLRGNGEAAVITSKPADDAVIHGQPGFAWRHFANAASYRVTITTASGSVVLEKITTDTTTTFADLRASGTFRWYVTAILANGATVASPVHSFVVQ